MKVLNNSYPPRSDIPISNVYEIIPSDKINPEEFHVVLYYINEHNLKLVARQLDTLGWTDNLQIKLYSKNKIEILTIGPNLDSNTDAIIKNYTTNIKLTPVNLIYQQKIPKRIVQTNNSTQMNILIYNSVMSFMELNPEYEYKFFDDTACRRFIKKNYDAKTLEAYDMLVPGAYKADLFRYCYIYKKGGCYFDCKFILKVPLRDLIQKDSPIMLCRGQKPIYYTSGMIMAVPGHEKLKKVIDTCVSRINNYNKYRHESIVFLTGPELLCSVCSEIAPWAEVRNTGNKKTDLYIFRLCDNKKIIRLHNKSYIANYEQIHGMERYVGLWQKKHVIYQNKRISGKYILYVYPHRKKFKFHLNIANEMLHVRNMGNIIGWDTNLKVKIIDDENNTERLITVGYSKENERVIQLTF